MDANDDFNGKELNLNCFYMHTIFGQKYPKTAMPHEQGSGNLKRKVLDGDLFSFNDKSHTVPFFEIIARCSMGKLLTVLYFSIF